MSSVVFTFGRFQPPTTGHRRLIQSIVEEAEARGADAKVFVSMKLNDMSKIVKSKAFLQMKDRKEFESLDILENPLTSESKLNILRQQYAGEPIEFEAEKTFFSVVARLKAEGYTSLVLIVGEKRANELRSQLLKYHPDIEIVGKTRPGNKSNVEKRANSPLTNINNSVQVSVSKGNIDEVILSAEEESEEGMSSSAVRKAAIRGTPQSIQFILRHIAFGSYSRDEAMGLINEIRVGMGYRPLEFVGGGKKTRKYTKNKLNRTRKSK